MKNNYLNSSKMSKKSSYYQNDDLNEITKGFEMFDIENKGQIDPLELKETMEEMNLKDKNPFIYEFISYLCNNKDIKSKGGLTPDEFISFLEEEIRDVETKKGIKRIFQVFSDLDNKIPMPAFYQKAKEVGDENGGLEIKNLIQQSKTGAKELDFDEFYDIMKGNNEYTHIGNDNEKESKRKKKRIRNATKEYIEENEYINENNNTPMIQKSGGVIIIDKIITEQSNDNPAKISRYHYRYNKKENLNDNEENNKDEEKDLNVEEVDDEKNQLNLGQRFHSRYKESKITTEKIYSSNLSINDSYNNIIPANNTNIVYTKFKRKKDN